MQTSGQQELEALASQVTEKEAELQSAEAELQRHRSREESCGTTAAEANSRLQVMVLVHACTGPDTATVSCSFLRLKVSWHEPCEPPSVFPKHQLLLLIRCLRQMGPNLCCWLADFLRKSG